MCLQQRLQWLLVLKRNTSEITTTAWSITSSTKKSRCWAVPVEGFLANGTCLPGISVPMAPHRSLSKHQLDADFATTMQQSEVGQDSDMGGEDPIGILSSAARGIAQNTEEAITLPGSLVLWSPDGQIQDAGKKLMVITDLAMREREKSATNPWWDHISIFDGEREHGVPESHLSIVQSFPVDVPRALTNALASTKDSPPPQHTETGHWTWLSSLEGRQGHSNWASCSSGSNSPHCGL